MKRPTPATAISLVALFFSLGGVGLAAERYVITSASQIKPSVLKYLRGGRGPVGPAGSTGSVGPTGPAGAAGSQGAQGSQGIQGVAGTPASMAYANVARSGVWNGFGVTNVTHTANSGIYCVTPPTGVSPAYNAAVTLDIDSDYGAYAVIDVSSPDCGAGATEVDTGIATVGASNTPGATFDGAAADEAFVIVYP